MTGDLFATAAIALYAAHHVGDYWVQSDSWAREKGMPTIDGRLACALHVLSYVMTQLVFLAAALIVTGVGPDLTWQLPAALAVSGVTHWTADRREHGLMFWLARKIPGKANFLVLGAPRGRHYDDNPTLGTGAWALDQSWHIFWGVFVAALIIAA
jgi:hypothetical protein